MNYSKLLLRVLAVKDAVKALEEELRERIAEKAPAEVCGAGGPDELCDDGFCSICAWKGIG